LDTHIELKNWLLSYRDHLKTNKNKNQNETVIDDKAMALAKFFIECNIPIIACENKNLRYLVDRNLGKCGFKNRILPQLMNKLNSKLEQKLTEAVSICLVTDIWSSVAVIPFLGLAAMIINDKFEKEIIIIGLTEMSLPQNAENVKKAIESIINGFNFNKIEIFAVVCD